MFEPFDGVPDYPSLEKQVLEFWETREIFRQLREQTEHGPAWNFQDGPITANNRMGVHHAWGRTYKDLFDRFAAMNGRRLRWQNGFDCQGLWVEVEVEKQLGFATKTDILDFGMDNFSRACRARVEEFAEVIAAQSKRLGMWMDWDRSYYTYDDSNIEGIWGFLARCHELGWLAPDYRVMPWCPRCETSLSQHESKGAYKDVTHRSVYLRLPLDNRPESLLVWTTTPWTLTANVAYSIRRLLLFSKFQLKSARRPKATRAFLASRDAVISFAPRVRHVATRVAQFRWGVCELQRPPAKRQSSGPYAGAFRWHRRRPL